MSKRHLLIFLALLLFLAACGGDTSGPEAVVSEEETAVVATTEPIEAVAEEAAEPTEAPEPEPAPTEESVEEPASEPPTVNLTDECVTDYQEGVDYFPQKASIEYTSGFSIEYFNHYKVLTVPTPFSGAEAGETYVLVQCGTPIPDGFEDATLIETPINRFVSMSTTYLPHLVELDVVEKLVAIDSAGFISTAEIRAKSDAGELAEIGFGAEVNVEVTLEVEPDLVMTFASGLADFDAHPKLREAGIAVALSADFLDTSPLGRAEWGKFIALFFNKEEAAKVWFSNVASQYETLTTLVSESGEEAPTVFSESPFDGTWYAPGGGSYTAQLFSDAGASYIFADDESTGSLFLDFESVFDAASELDYWLNIGFFGTLADLEAADARFADFAAFQNGAVYNHDLRTNEFGGNDFFESGSANPHLVLADLIKVFHPDLVPDHNFVYYRIVE